jgi:hypothetical protein
MSDPKDLFVLTQATLHYARAVADTLYFKEALQTSYQAWRCKTQNFEYIQRHSTEWKEMLLATASEYQQLRNAKSREWRAKKKLLTFAKRWERA